MFAFIQSHHRYPFKPNEIHQVSAVSTKRHTTRENTLGIMTVEDAQVIFYDTPGFVSHEDRDDYKPALSAASREAIAEVNLTLLLVDASKDVTKRGLRSLMGLLERALRSGPVLFLCSNDQRWHVTHLLRYPIQKSRADGVPELEFLVARCPISQEPLKRGLPACL